MKSNKRKAILDMAKKMYPSLSEMVANEWATLRMSYRDRMEEAKVKYPNAGQNLLEFMVDNDYTCAKQVVNYYNPELLQKTLQFV